MKIVTVLGARPQFIKSSVLSRKFLIDPNFNEIIIHTGQHFDERMSNIFFEELGIPKPNYNLNINSLSHGAMVGQQLEAIEKILIKEDPDLLLVYGDTNSTLSGALAASKLKVKIVHIEAGMRSFNNNEPEEINRVLTDKLTNIFFTPTHNASKNLINEGVPDEKIFFVGDIMYEVALFYAKVAEKKSKILEIYGLKSKTYFLCTIHRQSNTENIEKLNSIFTALSKLEKKVLLPIHPRTKNIIIKNDIKINSNVIIVDPVGYLDMVMLEKNAYKIITDSGGIQKEAFFHKVDCITMRNETEWVELVDAGVNFLVGNSSEKIINAVKTDAPRKAYCSNFYGNGNTSLKIIEVLSSLY